MSASDPLTLAVVAATLALVALGASLVPAYRAARLDPVRALRANERRGLDSHATLSLDGTCVLT